MIHGMAEGRKSGVTWRITVYSLINEPEIRFSFFLFSIEYIYIYNYTK